MRTAGRYVGIDPGHRFMMEVSGSEHVEAREPTREGTMEHVVQIGINLDDEAIRRAVVERAADEIIDYLKRECLKALGFFPTITSLSAWMPSKMASSSGPSFSGWEKMSERICRANSYLGT